MCACVCFASSHKYTNVPSIIFPSDLRGPNADSSKDAVFIE